MLPPTFADLSAQMFRLYLDGQYAEAYDLVTREAPRFPERAPRLYYWRVCLASVKGDTALALHLMDEAFAAGHWFSPFLLREDSDLKPLQGLPEFERGVEICQERLAAAQAQAVPQITTLRPAGPRPKAYPLLMALHGNQQNMWMAGDRWGPAVSRGWLLGLPQSSQVAGPDMFVWDDREWAVREVQAHFATLCEQYEVDRGRVVLGGFSAGAETAVLLALKGVIPARGVIAVGPGGPYTNEPEKWRPIVEASKNRDLRAYLIVGEEDVFRLKGTQALAEFLRSRGLPCGLEVHPGLAHDFPPAFEQSLLRALAFVEDAIPQDTQ